MAPYESLKQVNQALTGIRNKVESGQRLRYGDIVSLMNIVASKLVVKASERQVLFQRLNEMRIPNIAHNLQTKYLEEQFGDLPMKTGLTLFEEAKRYLKREIILNPSVDLQEAFRRNFDKLPPSSDLVAVYEMLPRKVEYLQPVHPPVAYKPDNISSHEWLGILKWWQHQPDLIKKALANAEEKHFVDLALTLSYDERMSASQYFDGLQKRAMSTRLDQDFVGKSLYQLASDIDDMIKEKTSARLVFNTFDLFSILWTGIDGGAKGDIVELLRADKLYDAADKLIFKGGRDPIGKRLINDFQAAYNLNIIKLPENTEQARGYRSDLYGNIARKLLAQDNANREVRAAVKSSEAELYLLLNLSRDPNKEAIRKRVAEQWRLMNRSTPEEMVAVVTSFGKSAKGLVWDLPKGAAWDPLVNKDNSFYTGLAHVFSNPEVLASLIINEIDTAHLKAPEALGALSFELALSVILIPSSGGKAAFKVLEKMEDMDLDKARRLTQKLEKLAEKAAATLRKSGRLSQKLKNKAQDLADLAAQAKAKLKKLEEAAAARSLEEMAESAARAGKPTIAKEIRGLSKALQGGKVILDDLADTGRLMKHCMLLTASEVVLPERLVYEPKGQRVFRFVHYYPNDHLEDGLIHFEVEYKGKNVAKVYDNGEIIKWKVTDPAAQRTMASDLKKLMKRHKKKFSVIAKETTRQLLNYFKTKGLKIADVIVTDRIVKANGIDPSQLSVPCSSK